MKALETSIGDREIVVSNCSSWRFMLRNRWERVWVMKEEWGKRRMNAETCNRPQRLSLPHWTSHSLSVQSPQSAMMEGGLLMLGPDWKSRRPISGVDSSPQTCELHLELFCSVFVKSSLVELISRFTYLLMHRNQYICMASHSNG